jgi:hypothetical protein
VSLKNFKPEYQFVSPICNWQRTPRQHSMAWEVDSNVGFDKPLPFSIKSARFKN